MARGEQVPLEDYFAGRPDSRALFDVVRAAVEELGVVTVRVTRSQVAFRRRSAFAWAWVPGQYLRGDVASLVLSIHLSREDSSPRWKEVVEPRPAQYVHHLELHDPGQVDDEVRAWLQEAYASAG
jgi:Domain of unknown function (DUF5655)